jgi:hypothetical protein
LRCTLTQAVGDCYGCCPAVVGRYDGTTDHQQVRIGGGFGGALSQCNCGEDAEPAVVTDFGVESDGKRA